MILSTRYGKGWKIWPTQYYLFAFESKMSLKNIIDTIDNTIERSRLPLHRRIDTICVLNQGVISNRYKRSGGFEAIPSKGTTLDTLASKNNALLVFYTLMSDILNQGIFLFRPFKFSLYAEKYPL